MVIYSIQPLTQTWPSYLLISCSSTYGNVSEIHLKLWKFMLFYASLLKHSKNSHWSLVSVASMFAKLGLHACVFYQNPATARNFNFEHAIFEYHCLHVKAFVNSFVYNTSITFLVILISIFLSRIFEYFKVLCYLVISDGGKSPLDFYLGCKVYLLHQK